MSVIPIQGKLALARANLSSSTPDLLLANVPHEMRAYKQYLVWAYEIQGERLTKIPRQASDPGRYAKSNDRADYATFDDAISCWLQHPSIIDGVGFALTDNDPYFACDIDSEGKVDQEHLDERRFNADALLRNCVTYTETSPSGDGIRMIGRGRLPIPGTKSSRLGIELFGTRGWVTLTGRVIWGRSDITEQQPFINAIPFKPRVQVSLEDDDELRSLDLSDEQVVAQLSCSEPKFADVYHYRAGAEPKDWSTALYHAAAALDRVTGSAAQVQRVLMASPLVQKAPPKDSETRPAKAARLLPDILSKVRAENNGILIGRRHGAEQASNISKYAGAARREDEMSGTSNVFALSSGPGRSLAAEDARPVIRLVADQLKATADKSEQALIESDRGLYQRGGLIVSVDQVNVITADAKMIAARQISERGDYALLEDLSVTARYEKYDKRSKCWAITSPPMDIVKLLKQRHGRLRLPVLSGVINTPTMRPDGSLLCSPGYDPTTGLLFDPGDILFWDVKDQPAKPDAEDALAALRNLIATFPFVSDADRSVALAAMMTAVVRHALPTAPLFGFSAPVAGSGKSKLVDLVSVVANGRNVGVLAQGKTDEETEKRLASVLLAGDGIIAVDNCDQPLGGDLLCQMLTQTTVRIRILGKSQTIELPTSALIRATGNNLTLVGDMTRRALICKLDPRVERPELRTFNSDPVEDAKANRKLFVAAILTALRAYIAAGRPRQANPLGSFEAWSDLVRNSLIWLGCADPIETMEQVRMGDPHTIARQTVMAQWRRAIRGRVSVGGALKVAEDHPDFHDALMLVAGVSDKINAVRLGKWLGRNKDMIVTISGTEGSQPVQGCFRQDGLLDGKTMWMLQES